MKSISPLKIPSTARQQMARRRALGVAALALAGSLMCASAAVAQATNWPTQTIKIVVPFAPGGANDVLARILTEKLSAALGQPVIAENRPGAGATLAAGQVAAAKPDGYTLMMFASPHLVGSVIYKDLPYDALTSFAPVGRLAVSPFVMVVNPDVPAKTVMEFIALAKARPGQLNFSSSGNGSNQHLYGQMFLTATGIDMKHVPYKGSAPATVDLVSGQVQVSFMALPNALPHLKSGRLRALGVISSRRVADLPEVPTLTELGLPGFEEGGWIALVAPKGTPAVIVARLDRELQDILARPETAKVLAGAGMEPDPMPPDRLEGFIRTESVKWIKVARSVNLTQ